MTFHRSCFTGTALLFAAGASVACTRAHAQSAPSATAAIGGQQQPSAASRASAAPAPAEPQSAPDVPSTSGDHGGASARQEEDQTELVVSRDVVMHCPTLRLVREHVEQFDPDMVWLAVLESIGDCMGSGGPMSAQSIGVSGDEEHRHVVREILGARGIAPTRIVAAQASAGAAECQPGTDCTKRVEITIAPGR